MPPYWRSCLQIERYVKKKIDREQKTNEKLNNFCLVIRRKGLQKCYYRHHVSIKTCHFYFLNNSVKHWQILLILGMQHYQETLHK